jgi:hypothetical protein
VLRRIRPLRTLRAQKAELYLLRIRIKMRSSQYAAPPQDADAGAGVSRSSWGRSIIRGKAGLTRMCEQADLSRCLLRNVLRAVESLLLGYNDLQDGFEGLWNMSLGVSRGSGTLQQTGQGRMVALRAS